MRHFYVEKEIVPFWIYRIWNSWEQSNEFVCEITVQHMKPKLIAVAKAEYRDLEEVIKTTRMVKKT